MHVEAVGAGPPLVLLHGWGMHGGLWAPIVPALARRYRVHAVDLPGHGRSPAPARFDLAGLVAAMTSHFGGECALTVVGWSLGALVALEWARVSPAAVQRLVLTGATPRFVAGPGWPHGVDDATLQRFGGELRAAYEPTLRRFLALQLQGSDAGRAALGVLRQQLFARGRPSAAVLAAGLALLRTVDLRAAVPSLLQRALVIAGERDTLAPLAAGRWLAAHLPHGTLAPIPGAAHIGFLSHPHAFLQSLATLDDDS